MTEAQFDMPDEQSSAELENHTAGCPGCRQTWQEMRNALEIMRQREKQNPDPEFMSRFWARLSPRLQTSRKGFFREISLDRLARPRFVLPLTAALCLFLGVWIGQHSSIKEKRPIVTDVRQTEKGKGVSVETRASLVLERSQRVFLAFSNFDVKTDDPEILNLSYQKSMARNLIRETGSLKAELPNGADRKLTLLLSDLELILLQIANLEDTYDMDNIEIIRDGVNKRSVLFEIQMNTLNRSGKQDADPDSRHI